MSRAPLGRRFWLVWTAASASNVGDGIVLAAVPLLAASLTRDPVSVAATTVAVRLPWLVFGLFAGVIIDRTDRLRMMIGTDAARALAFGLIAVAVATDNITLLALYVVLFAAGVLETLFDTAAMSMTPRLVAPERLERANAFINGSLIAGNDFAGPPLGAGLFAVAAALPFGVDAATFAASAVLLLSVGGRYRPVRAARTTVLGDIREGFGFVWREPVIRAFAIGAGVINLGFTAPAAVLVLHAQDNLGLDELGFGLLLASAAIGGIAGAAAAPSLIQRLSRRVSIMAAITTIAGGVAVMGLADTLWPAAIGFALFGFAGEVWNIVSVTYRQTATPDGMLGRVMAGFRVIAYGTFPIGAAVGGVIAAGFGLRAPFFVGSALTALLIPVFVVVTRRHSLDPRG
jgi:MFS family permease